MTKKFICHHMEPAEELAFFNLVEFTLHMQNKTVSKAPVQLLQAVSNQPQYFPAELRRIATRALRSGLGYYKPSEAKNRAWTLNYGLFILTSAQAQMRRHMYTVARAAQHGIMPVNDNIALAHLAKDLYDINHAITTAAAKIRAYHAIKRTDKPEAERIKTTVFGTSCSGPY